MSELTMTRVSMSTAGAIQRHTTNDSKITELDHRHTSSTLPRLLRRVWKWITMAMIVSIAVAIYWANTHATPSFFVHSRLAFQKTAFGAPLYQGPDVYSLAAEFTSPETLERMRDELGLKVPADLIARRLKASVLRGNSGVELSMDWENVDDAKMLLDKIIEVGNARVKELRDFQLEEHVAALRESVSETYKPRCVEYAREYDQLSSRYGVVNLEIAVSELDQRLHSLEDDLKRELLSSQVIQQRQKKLRSSYAADRLRSPMPSQHSLGLIALTSGQASLVSTSATRPSISPSNTLQRIDDLKREVERERLLAIARAKLEHKRVELARLQSLADKRLIPRSRYTAMMAEVEGLELQVHGNQTTQELETELEDLVGKASSADGEFMEDVEEYQDRKNEEDELEREIIVSKVRMDHLKSEISDLQSRSSELQKVLPQAKRLSKQISVAEEQIESRMSLADGLENLEHTNINSFHVVMPATDDPSRASTDWRKQFAAVFTMIFLGLATPISAMGMRAVAPTPGLSLAKRLQLQDFGSVSRIELNRVSSPTEDTEPVHSSVRLVALRFKRMLGDRGGDTHVIHIVSLGSIHSIRNLANQLAKSLVNLGDDVDLVFLEDQVGNQRAATDATTVSQECDSGRREPRLLVRNMPFSCADEIVDTVASPCKAESPGRILLIVSLSLSDESTIGLISLKSEIVALAAPGGDAIGDNAKELAVSLNQYHMQNLGVIH